jgi:hypothetical protein
MNDGQEGEGWMELGVSVDDHDVSVEAREPLGLMGEGCNK